MTVNVGDFAGNVPVGALAPGIFALGLPQAPDRTTQELQQQGLVGLYHTEKTVATARYAHRLGLGLRENFVPHSAEEALIG